MDTKTAHDYDTTIAYLKSHHKDRSIHGVIEHLSEDREKSLNSLQNIVE